MVEAEILLKCSIFIVILDSGKNFSLALKYKGIDIILLVERIDDMGLPYQLFSNKFQASPESTFELPCLTKLLTQIVDNENGEYFCQVVKLKKKTFNKEKILSKTTMCYM